MPSFQKPSLITLRRPDLSQPWGFRLIGGVNYNQPFTVQKVTSDSIADRCGLREGDELVRIGNITLQGLTHEEVQEIILRCHSTIDLFITRKGGVETPKIKLEQPNPLSKSVQQKALNKPEEQKNMKKVVHSQYNSPLGLYSAKNIAEQVHVMTEGAYFTSDRSDPLSPVYQQMECYVKEEEAYQYTDYHSPTPPRQSPFQKPPPSNRPFSPTIQSPTSRTFSPTLASTIGRTHSPTPSQNASSRPFSPISQTSTISYHRPDEQQWSSTMDERRVIDTRVFGTRSRSRSNTPVREPPVSLPTTLEKPQTKSFTKPEVNLSDLYQNVDRVPKPLIIKKPSVFDHIPENEKILKLPEVKQQIPEIHPKSPDVKQKLPETKQKLPKPHQTPITKPKTPELNGQPLTLQDQRVFAAKPNVDKAIKVNRSAYNNAIDAQSNRNPDRRVFGKPSRKPRVPYSNEDWKSALPQVQNQDHLLPSQAKEAQTYITQTNPTEQRFVRPPPTGANTIRRRIRPAWPPNEDGSSSPKPGFYPKPRDNKKYQWPPSNQSSFDDEYYYEDGMMSPASLKSPRSGYMTPPPGALQHVWNPKSGTETPPGFKSFRPSRRTRNSQWPPPSNATPAGRIGISRQSSLPGSRRSSQVNEYLSYNANPNRIPTTYRPPPGTQYYQPTYHYDTD